MTPKERLIDAFRALCEREGGHVAVADAVGANEQALWQIVAGIKLPSGQPRGVGPSLQRKLEDRFPGWASPQGPQPPFHPDTMRALAAASPETRAQIENVVRAMLAPQAHWSTPSAVPQKRAANAR